MKILTILIALFLAFAGLTVIYSNQSIGATKCTHNDDTKQEKIKDATCTSKEVWYCKQCKQKYKKGNKNADNHTGTQKTQSAANCISKKKMHCTSCNKDYNVGDIDPNNHVGDQTPVSAGDCVTKGKNHCESCGKDYDTKINSNNHKPYLEKCNANDPDPTCITAIKYKCSKHPNHIESVKNKTNHQNPTPVEDRKEPATCVNFAIWQLRYTCCGEWTGETYKKEDRDKSLTANVKYKYDGKTYHYGYDLNNHEHTKKVDYKHGYRYEYKIEPETYKKDGETVTKVDENGDTVYAMYKYTYEEYICDACKGTYRKKIGKKKKIATEDVMKKNNADNNIESVRTSIKKVSGQWNRSASYDWAHTDNNSDKLEFLPVIYNNGDHDYQTTGTNNKTVKDSLRLLLCKYKHGSIRFTPDIPDITDEAVTAKIDPRLDYYVIDDVKGTAVATAETLLKEGDYYKASTNVVTQLFRYYRGTSYDTPNLKNGWYGSYPSYTYYGAIFCETPEWKEDQTIEETNNKEAYILSSGKKFSPTNTSTINFKQGNYKKTYSDEADEQLIQDALWEDKKTEENTNGFNEGGVYEGTSANSQNLYEEAKDYEDFYNDNLNGKKYTVTTNRKNAQTIVKSEEKIYIVGPFTVEYPNDHRFSYIEDIKLEAKHIDSREKKEKIVELNLDQFEVITASGTVYKDGKQYPESGENFWIKFNAETAEYPTSVNIKMTFAYLDTTYAKYTTYKGEGVIKQIVGTLEKRDIDEVAYYDKKYKDEDGDGIFEKEEDDPTKPHYYYRFFFSTTHNTQVGTYPAQKLAMLTTRKRTWKRTTKNITASTGQDLTMELGGQVWEDTKGGKMTENDNVYDKSKAINNQTDKPMPNVIVTLYRYDKNGNKIKAELTSYEYTDKKGKKEQIQNPTKTDSNGKYLFTGINSMYKYFVEFTYNSQYYEPVEYVSPSNKDNGWVNYEKNSKGNWNINSNGTDVQEERKSINVRFASIGSSPANYTVTEENNRTNKTFTKKQLQGYTLNENGEYVKTKEAVIDEFGNLIKEKSNSNTTETNEMIQYVKDCMLNSYTGKDIKQNNKTVRKNDLYPIYSNFVLDDSGEAHNYEKARSILILANKGEINANINFFFDNDANLYINQGYTLRRTSDLSLNKDVYKVTLETNGQTHEYTYNKLDKFKCNNCGRTGTNDELNFSEDYGVNICPNPNCKSKNVQNVWDIDLRLSDVGLIDSEKRYYNTEYTRELYASDYAYKVSMYGDYNELGKSKDDELKVYITYKIGVRNQSQSILCRADEIVDYYDEDLTYVPERSYIQVSNKKYLVNGNNESIYKQAGTRTNINNYKNLYITGLGKNSQEIDNNGNNVRSEAEGLYLTSGKTAYIYLTFEVNKKTENNEDWVILDEDLATGNVIGVGKENIAEINGYTTKYKEGTTIPNVEGDVSGQPAGIVDRDSNPGNLNPTDVPKDGTPNYKNFEDDTDKAPNIKLKIDRNDDHNRVISGTVWEDERKVSGEKVAIGNGLRENSETLIDGVTVQLVELLDDGKEFVWREFGTNQIGNFGTNAIGKGTGSGTVQSETPIIGLSNIVGNIDLGNDHKGKYAFKSFMPGKYVVRFIYGDTVRTVYPSELGGLNSKSYNGQDYKSTTYQKDIPQNKTYEWRRNSTWVNGQEQKGEIITKIHAYNTDNCTNNETAIKKQLNDNEQKGYLYDITTADSISLSKKQNASDAKDIESRRNKVIEYSEKNVTNYKAEVLAAHKADYNTMNSREDLIKDLIDNTKMTAETGMMVIEFEYDRTQTDTKDAVQDTSIYKVQNVDLGLEERPKAQLEINKEVTNVKLTLADGSTLFDAKQTASNILWKDHKKYDTGYKNNMLDENKFGSIANIRAKNTKDSRLGLIQLSMDEELMHGAKIQITYQITVTNVGEVDYKENKFYYTGTVADKNTIVKTTANQIIDYVANNLQFDSSLAENTDWEVINQDKLITQDKTQDLVNKNLKSKVEQYNTIITTKENATIAKTELVPDLYDNKKSSASTNLVLTQLITAENKTDDLTYKNIVEIVKTSNNVGRRNEYSVVGNQDPTMEPQEIDSDRAEIVKILPPFGNAGLYIIITITTIIAIGLLAGGIVFIRRKILKK